LWLGPGSIASLLRWSNFTYQIGVFVSRRRAYVDFGDYTILLYYTNIYTLRLFNIAMENGPFIDAMVYLLKMVIFHGYVSRNQMVYIMGISQSMGNPILNLPVPGASSASSAGHGRSFGSEASCRRLKSSNEDHQSCSLSNGLNMNKHVFS
jgi:hypothetical protein